MFKTGDKVVFKHKIWDGSASAIFSAKLVDIHSILVVINGSTHDFHAKDPISRIDWFYPTEDFVLVSETSELKKLMKRIADVT